MAAQPSESENIPSIRSIMSKEVYGASWTDSLPQIINVMAKKAISCVVVVNADKKPIGIISERDLIKKLAAKGKRINELSLNDVMSSPVHVITPDADILEVSRLMREKKMRRFPVIENNKLIGIITETDVLRGLIHCIKYLNWSLVERQIRKTKYEGILKEIKTLVNS